MCASNDGEANILPLILLAFPCGTSTIIFDRRPFPLLCDKKKRQTITACDQQNKTKKRLINNNRTCNHNEKTRCCTGYRGEAVSKGQGRGTTPSRGKTTKQMSLQRRQQREPNDLSWRLQRDHDTQRKPGDCCGITTKTSCRERGEAARAVSRERGEMTRNEREEEIKSYVRPVSFSPGIIRVNVEQKLAFFSSFSSFQQAHFPWELSRKASLLT